MINQRLVSRLKSIDWDFSDSFSDSPFSSIHWHPARFASQLPATFIGLLTRPGALVLDPFVGSGTTVVEAQRLGRRGLGIDLNPISCLATRSKTMSIPAEKLRRHVVKLKSAADAVLNTQPLLGQRIQLRHTIPKSVQTRKWYTNRVAERLALLWSEIQKQRNDVRLLGEAAFSAILLPVCRETRHWGYVCDNTQPIADHEGDVLVEFARVLDRLVLAYCERDLDLAKRFGPDATPGESEVIHGDARRVLATLSSRSVDLVLTSPPYFGVCDYAKAQRLSMEWIGGEIEPIRAEEIGARSKRHRRSALEEYLDDLQTVFEQARRVLKRDGALVIIIGQSSKRASVMTEMRERLQKIGFTIELDQNRCVRSQRRQAPSITGEHVLVYS